MWKLILSINTITLMVSSSNSVQITCQFNGDTCNVPGTPTTTSSTELITIAGMPINYVNNAVKNVQMNGCPNIMSFQIGLGNIPLIPAGFAQSSTRLIMLAFMQTNTVRIDRSAFLGLTNLQFLYLSYNQITCLPYDIFQNTPNLKTIDFTGNKITALDLNIFKNLRNLESANFQNNLIATIPSFDLTSTTTLMYTSGLQLNLMMNPVKSVNPDICNIIKARMMINNKAIKIGVGMTLCQQGLSNIDFSICMYGMTFLQPCFNTWISQTYVPIKCV